MKKPFQKLINGLMKKVKEEKEPIRKLRFSTYQEDFVITEQEEREGGFFGTMNLKLFRHLK